MRKQLAELSYSARHLHDHGKRNYYAGGNNHTGSCAVADFHADSKLTALRRRMKNWKGNCMYLWQPVRCLCSALLATAAIALLFISLPASGQTTTATLSGYAQDQTGAIIPGATAILTNQS